MCYAVQGESEGKRGKRRERWQRDSRLNGLDGDASPTSGWSAANVSVDPGNRKALGTIRPRCSSEFERKTFEIKIWKIME